MRKNLILLPDKKEGRKLSQGRKQEGKSAHMQTAFAMCLIKEEIERKYLRAI